MAKIDRSADRPPLKPQDVYRPRLGTQREPLSKTTTSELRAWREASARAAIVERPEQSA